MTSFRLWSSRFENRDWFLRLLNYANQIPFTFIAMFKNAANCISLVVVDGLCPLMSFVDAITPSQRISRSVEFCKRPRLVKSQPNLILDRASETRSAVPHDHTYERIDKTSASRFVPLPTCKCFDRMSEFLHVEVGNIKFPSPENSTPIGIELLPLSNCRQISRDHNERMFCASACVEITSYSICDQHKIAQLVSNKPNRMHQCHSRRWIHPY